MSKVSENLKFLTISAFECENPESLGISGFFTLHVASLGTALPDEFGSFPPDSFFFVPHYPFNLRPRTHPAVLLDNVTRAG